MRQSGDNPPQDGGRSQDCQGGYGPPKPEGQPGVHVNHPSHNIRYNIVEGKLLTVKVEVNGRELDALIDTGSVITMIDWTVAKDSGCQITNYHGPRIVSGNGKPYECIGMTKLEITVRSVDADIRIIPHPTLVVPNLACDMLIGNDFNRRAGTCISFEAHDPVVYFPVEREHALCVASAICKDVHCRENVTVPPRSKKLLPVSVSGTLQVNSVVNVKKGSEEIEITNFSGKSIDLRAGTVIGKFDDV